MRPEQSSPPRALHMEAVIVKQFYVYGSRSNEDIRAEYDPDFVWGYHTWSNTIREEVVRSLKLTRGLAQNLNYNDLLWFRDQINLMRGV